MSYLIPTSNNAPIIERILSDPVTFVKAKTSDINTDAKPHSYKTFTAYKQDKSIAEKDSSPKIQSEVGNSSPARPKPKSMAEAIAAYTGKKFPTKLEKKIEKRESKKARKLERWNREQSELLNELVSGNDEEPMTQESDADAKLETSVSDIEASPALESDETSSDDNDYQTADEDEDDLGSSSSGDDDNDHEDPEADEEDDDDEEEDDDEDDENREESSGLGLIKLKDPEKEEIQDEDITKLNQIKSISPTPDEKEDISQEQNTPPTSPEDDFSGKSSPQHAYLPDDEFFQIDENYNDRGSNGSKRIYKNWRNLRKLKSPLGLVNQGVTCYMNAAVQALIHTPAVQHYLTDVHNNKYSNTISNHSVTKTFADTSAKIWQLDNDGNRKISMINPRKLIRRLADINCMMSEFQQEDSHEYFMSLMSRLQEDSTPKGHKLNESIIYDIFGGLLHQSVSCKNCGHVSKTEQEFYDLSLNLDNRRKQPGQEDEEISMKRYSIKRSINDFFSPELIKTDKKDKSGYVCEKCKQRTNALKHNEIKRAPETLAVHLKRFRFNGISSSKLKTGVSYPSTLDLTHFTVDGEPSRYKLIAVVVHEGRSVSSGHYIVQCRQPDGSWSVYDDEYINKTTEKEVLKNTSAYFLIYTRLTHKSKESDWVSTSEKRRADDSANAGLSKRSRK